MAHLSQTTLALGLTKLSKLGIDLGGFYVLEISGSRIKMQCHLDDNLMADLSGMGFVFRTSDSGKGWMNGSHVHYKDGFDTETQDLLDAIEIVVSGPKWY